MHFLSTKHYIKEPCSSFKDAVWFATNSIGLKSNIFARSKYFFKKTIQNNAEFIFQENILKTFIILLSLPNEHTHTHTHTHTHIHIYIYIYIYMCVCVCVCVCVWLLSLTSVIYIYIYVYSVMGKLLSFYGMISMVMKTNHPVSIMASHLWQ